ncbi:DUF3073 family protein [Actinomadura rubteroloni]|uniref:DUF3073 family protein n=1 Tax=Actinomadura rubteroloni TaxID=1926885 RepID=UPI000CD82B22
MGRGRAKAKQAKVARRLKYGGGGGDLESLSRELGATAGGDDASVGRADEAGRRQVEDRSEETVGESGRPARARERRAPMCRS